jgi:hypothetical protein
VRREDAVGIDLRIVEKAVRGLELGSVERLRKRAAVTKYGALRFF